MAAETETARQAEAARARPPTPGRARGRRRRGRARAAADAEADAAAVEEAARVAAAEAGPAGRGGGARQAAAEVDAAPPRERDGAGRRPRRAGRPSSRASCAATRLHKYLPLLREHEILDAATVELMARADFADIGLPVGARVRCARDSVRAGARPASTAAPAAAAGPRAQPAARNECAVCFEDFEKDTARCVLQPCGHAGVCLACGRAQTACPICRVPVERAQPIY